MPDIRMDDDKFRISALASSSDGVIKIHPDKSLEEATTVMLMHDFSQLPVMTTDRNVKGTISWKSIGTSLRLSDSPKLVKDCMDSQFTVLSVRENFLKAVKEISVESHYVDFCTI